MLDANALEGSEANIDDLKYEFPVDFEFEFPQTSHAQGMPSMGKGSKPGFMVKDEVDLRRKESMGLALTGNQKLGGSRMSSKAEQKAQENTSGWSCLVCTL